MKKLAEQKYLEIMKDIYDNGNVKGDRTGTGTKSIFGTHLKHDLREGFPLLTTKSVAFRLVAIELLWFLSGSTNINFLVDNNCHIWDEWAIKEGPLKGELGPVYGSQWRNWKGEDGKTYDQIAIIMSSLKNNPNSRRHIVSGWNVPYLPDESKSPEVNAKEGKMALSPCHAFYQFYVANGTLSSSVYIRSNDYFLGNPFNMASLALLTHMLAQQLDLVAGEINVMTGDTHLYSNHMDQAALQLERTPTALPTLKIIRKPDSIFDYKLEDFVIENYVHQGAIKAPISK